MPVKAVNRTCSICGHPFGPLLHRDLQDRQRCMHCASEIHRANRRKRATEIRAGLARPKSQNRLTYEQMRQAVAEHYAHDPVSLAGCSRTLPRTCEFCIHCNEGVSAKFAGWSCALLEVPDAWGGCESYQPRYRTEDEE